MARRYVRQLADGDTIDDIFLITDKQLRTNRQGNSFLQVDLRDRSGSITGRLWNAGESLFRGLDSVEFVRARGKVQLFQGALQVILNEMTPIAGETLDMSDFLPHTESDLAKLHERLRTLLLKTQDMHLRALAEVFLSDEAFMRGFSRAPAGVRQHHAYLGGLLEHVVCLMEGADKLSALYPDLNRDVVLMGLFLHDIGKIKELEFDAAFSYSDEGELLGHVVIGIEMLSTKVAEAEKLTEESFPNELLLRLKHIIASHHGELQYGAARYPMTPEAVFIHLLDTLDSRVHAIVRDIKEDKNPATRWTQFNPQQNRKFFKGTREM